MADRPPIVVKLVCGFEANTFIAAQIEWRALGDSATTLQEVVDLNPSTEFDYTIDLEVLITRRHIPRFRERVQDQCVFQDRNLTEDAFKPKTYEVHLAKGKFTSAEWLVFSDRAPENVPQYSKWWGLRLLFDRSPFPPLQEWKQDEPVLRGVMNYNFWENQYRDFYDNTVDSKDACVPSEESKRKAREVAPRVLKLGPWPEQQD